MDGSWRCFGCRLWEYGIRRIRRESAEEGWVLATRRSINQDDLRNHNLSVIIGTILRSQVPLGRTDLAKSSGLTKATLSLLAGILLDNHVVRELDPEQSVSSHGRPSTPLAIASGSWAGIGLQVNTDGFGCMALDLDGKVIDSVWTDSDMGDVDPDAVFAQLDDIALGVEQTLKEQGYTVAGAGLALPGLVDDNMRLLMARNLGWERVDLTGFDVVRRLHPLVGNEAKMAALAQIPGYATAWDPSACKDGANGLSPNDSFIYISTDVGIGGALVREGAIRPGDHGFAGELGHVSVDLNGPICRCGRRGCLETYAGRRALVEAAGVASGPEAVSAKAAAELYHRWLAGDARAVSAIDRALEAMLSVMASAVNIVDVDTVLLGGFWSNFGSELTDRLRSSLGSKVLAGPAMPVKVLTPAINAYPALRGAAEVGLKQFVDNPLRFFVL